jgi:hypothetical protein
MHLSSCLSPESKNIVYDLAGLLAWVIIEHLPVCQGKQWCKVQLCEEASMITMNN